MKTYDAIVVGSGAGGSMAAYRLAEAGLDVLLVEKGNALPRDGSTLDVQRVVHAGEFKSKEPWVDGRGTTVVPEEYFNLGGKTKWYGAALARFGAHEFGPDGAVNSDGFPFTYAELEPYYERAELLLGVRKVPVEEGLSAMLARITHRSPQWRWSALPLGLSREIDRDLVEATHFDGFASPRGLKADGERTLLARVSDRNNLRLLTGCAVHLLLADPTRPSRVVGVTLEDGSEHRAERVLLAAGALHTPRLVQRYIGAHALRHLPLSQHVGRNLKLHLLTAVLALTTARQHDSLRKTALLVNEQLPHSSAQPLGFDGELLATLVPSYVPRVVANEVGARAYGFFLQTEDASAAANRVVDANVEGNHGARPRLDYDASRSPHAEPEHRRFVSAFRRALFHAGYPNFARRIGIHGTAHACGTMAMGRDPALSAVAPDGRVHGIDGLYVVDGSVLPRISRVNPALTIYAWSLRVADRIVGVTTGSDQPATRTAEVAS
jgi:choline dehydrogenase-like flavoprotein